MIIMIYDHQPPSLVGWSADSFGQSLVHIDFQSAMLSSSNHGVALNLFSPSCSIISRKRIKGYENRLLSHVGRVQLFHWDIIDIFNFWNMSSRLSIETLKELQSISYRYKTLLGYKWLYLKRRGLKTKMLHKISRNGQNQ